MKFNSKINVYFSMLIAAALITGLYGAMHNQLSYTVSSEYFTRFKFIQFGIPWAYEAPRLGAAYVGALASWWMGVMLCVFLGLLGFMFPTPRQMAANLCWSFLIVLLVATTTTLSGLLYAYMEIGSGNIANYARWLPTDIENPVQFIRAGTMHNASYIGGIVGLIVGASYLLVVRFRMPATALKT